MTPPDKMVNLTLLISQSEYARKTVKGKNSNRLLSVGSKGSFLSLALVHFCQINYMPTTNTIDRYIFSCATNQCINIDYEFVRSMKTATHTVVVYGYVS
jgi:hypothetical protein